MILPDSGTPARPKILILFSDAGGGHRTTAEAIVEAIRLEYPGRIDTETLDFFKAYSPYPFSRFPEWYPAMVSRPRAWGLAYHQFDRRSRIGALMAVLWLYVGRRAIRMLREHPADLVLTVHPQAIDPTRRALASESRRNRDRKPPFVVIVVDLISTHAAWFDPHVDLTLVPTEAAEHNARKILDPARVRLTGLPIPIRFSQPPANRNMLRKDLGWPLDRPMVLLVGGGEGMGPIEGSARAIASAFATAPGTIPGPVRIPGLAIAAGRNEAARQRLEQIDWPILAFVYSFRSDMDRLMHAADILVTKAGPATIGEALNCGLPMILYSRLPGQEEGSVGFIVEGGAGVWAPTPTEIVAAIRRWLDQPATLAAARVACRRMARPRAAAEIAHVLAGLLNVKIDRP